MLGGQEEDRIQPRPVVESLGQRAQEREANRRARRHRRRRQRHAAQVARDEQVEHGREDGVVRLGPAQLPWHQQAVQQHGQIRRRDDEQVGNEEGDRERKHFRS